MNYSFYKKYLSLLILLFIFIGCEEYPQKKIKLLNFYNSELTDSCPAGDEESLVFLEKIKPELQNFKTSIIEDWHIYNDEVFSFKYLIGDDYYIEYSFYSESDSYLSKVNKPVELRCFYKNKLFWSRTIPSAFIAAAVPWNDKSMLLYIDFSGVLYIRNYLTGELVYRKKIPTGFNGRGNDRVHFLMNESYLLIPEAESIIDYDKYRDFYFHATKNRFVLLQL